MAEVTVTKIKPEKAEVGFPEFATPFFRGSLFSLNPFALMRQFTEDMDRFYTPTTGKATGAFWAPALEVKQKEGKVFVTCELPGLAKEDVKVRVEGNTLVLEGERKAEKEEKREGFYHSERSYGKFYRSVALPEGAKADETKAQFTNGVLEVTVPVPVAKAKEVPVDVPVQGPPAAKAA